MAVAAVAAAKPSTISVFESVHARKHRKEDPDFRQAWDQAIEDGIDLLVAEIMLRARHSSDLLAMFLLKALRPEKYRQTAGHEHSGPDKGPITILWNAPEPAWAKDVKT